MKVYSNFWNPESLKHFESKYSNLPITFFMDNFPQTPNQLRENSTNILYIHEPNFISITESTPSGNATYKLHDYAIRNSNHFDLIITCHEKILNNCSNAIRFSHNSIISLKNIDLVEEFANKEKKFEISFLSGVKDISEGHSLRQQIWKQQDRVKSPRLFYYTLPDFDETKGVDLDIQNIQKIYLIYQRVKHLNYGEKEYVLSLCFILLLRMLKKKIGILKK